jgi:hypothetical protein
MQGELRGRLKQVGTRPIDVRIFQIAPGSADRKRKYFARVPMALDRHSRLKSDSDDPESAFDIHLQELKNDAFLIGHEGKILLGAVQR